MNNQFFDMLSTREKLGQLIMMDFRYYGKDSTGNYLPVKELPSQISKLISDYQLGGIALFRENVETPEQTVKLTENFQNLVNIPMLIGIDQEGGIVTRLQSGTDMPGNMSLGAADNYDLTKEVAAAIGRELNVLGINLNFAPTVDVNSCASNPIIGVRSFSSSPELVTRMGQAYIEGLNSASVIACLKHFPGHGNTVNDTHLGLATVDYTYDEMEKIDLDPFKKLIEYGTDTIMAAHVIVPTLDDSKCLSKLDGKQIGKPATLSYKILTELLREKLNFKGLLLTDALDMKAISDNFGAEDATIKTILAGADIAVMPIRIWEEKDIEKMETLFSYLEKEYKNNSLFRNRVEESVLRVINFKISKGLLDTHINSMRIKDKINSAQKTVGCKAHRQLEQKASAEGLTLIKNEDDILPFKLNNNSKILLLDSSESRLKILKEAIIKETRSTGKQIIINSEIIDYNSTVEDNLKNNIDNSDYIIMVTYNLDSAKTLPEQIAAYSVLTNKKLVTVSSRNPYDIAFIKSSKANLAIYGASGYDQTNYRQAQLTVNLKTAVKTIFNYDKKAAFNPKGKLPVTIIAPETKKIIFGIGHGLSYK